MICSSLNFDCLIALLHQGDRTLPIFEQVQEFRSLSMKLRQRRAPDLSCPHRRDAQWRIRALRLERALNKPAFSSAGFIILYLMG